MIARLVVLFSFYIFTSSVHAKYCAGIRGNGELAPAHWSSLARIVENKGMPDKASGGSSGSVSLFLLDGISRNQNLSLDEDRKAIEQALLLKTIVPHVLYLFNEDAKAPVVMRLVGHITGMGDGGFIHKVKNAIKIAKDAPTFFRMLKEYGPLINPVLARGLRNNFNFYKSQLMEGIKVFGDFNAETDGNIFYREGAIDFKFLGILFGRLADFYAGYGNKKTNDALSEFVKTCSVDSFGKEWDEIVANKQECGTLLTNAFDRYYERPSEIMYMRVGVESSARTIYKKRKFPNKMIFEKIGSGLESYPSTSLIVGAAASRYKKRLNEYNSSFAVLNEDFNVDFSSELFYGYWGEEDKLQNIKNNLKTLYPNDLKSQKFYPLDGGTWFEVLGTSPAEPGLANLQRLAILGDADSNRVINKPYFYSKWRFFPTFNAIPWFDEKENVNGVLPFREEMYSVGGWSDLHPSLMLRASGCENIIYVTRQGGETVFGQQIFIRLTGYTDKISFWKNIREKNRIGWFNLSAEEEASPWNKLYNLGNPESSYNRSINEADAIYCTNWDTFSVFKNQLKATLSDAWNAPVFLKDEDQRVDYNFGLDSAGKSPDNFPGCISQY